MLTTEDELPVIRDNLRKGFLEAQSNVNKWVQNFKKRLDGDDLDDLSSEPPRQGYANQAYPAGRQPPRRSGDMTRRSADRDRYDADPQVLPDDFSTLELRDTEGRHTSSRNVPEDLSLTPCSASTTTTKTASGQP